MKSHSALPLGLSGSPLDSKEIPMRVWGRVPKMKRALKRGGGEGISDLMLHLLAPDRLPSTR